jgi:hypothetical protein
METWDIASLDVQPHQPEVLRTDPEDPTRNTSTHDIDLVIDPTHEALDRFLAELDPAEVYAGPSPHAALDNRDQFNVIDLTSSWKVDLIIRKDRSFSRSEFERRAKADLLGMTVWVATADAASDAQQAGSVRTPGLPVSSGARGRSRPRSRAIGRWAHRPWWRAG